MLVIVMNKNKYNHDQWQTRANSIRFIDTKLWNILDSQIINSPTIYIFRRHCKMLMFHNLALCM